MEGISKINGQVENLLSAQKNHDKNNQTLETQQKKSVKLKDVEGQEYLAGTISNYSQKQIAESIAAMNKIIIGQNAKFEYGIHEKTGRLMIRLVDMETEEIVKEIPPEKFLDSVANIWEVSGILVNRKG